MKYLTYLKIGIAAFFAAIVITACNGNLLKTENLTKAIHLSPPPAAPVSATDKDALAKAKKININSAILSELDKIEVKLGIPALSNKIQAERPYLTIEDLIERQVVDRPQFDKIKDMVTVEEITMNENEKDADYMAKLELMKGHLFVAKELIKANKVEDAGYHVGHPVAEIYIDVSDRLHEHKVKEFKSSLLELEDLIKAGATDLPQLSTDFTESMRSIDRAIAALPTSRKQSPNFILQVINVVLDNTNSEYGLAVSNGKIGEEEEYKYQDSRGFMIYADTLYRSIAAKIATKYPALHQVISANIQQLKTVWPNIIHPKIAIKSPVEVGKIVVVIEQSSQKIIAN
jgi:Helix-hairpin-helix motif